MINSPDSEFQFLLVTNDNDREALLAGVKGQIKRALDETEATSSDKKQVFTLPVRNLKTGKDEIGGLTIDFGNPAEKIWLLNVLQRLSDLEEYFKPDRDTRILDYIESLVNTK